MAARGGEHFYTYYNKSGLPVSISASTGTLLDVDTQAVAFAVPKTLAHRSTLLRHIRDTMGRYDYDPLLYSVRKLMKEKYADRGAVYAVDCSHCYDAPWNYILFVVDPSYAKMRETYESIFRVCAEKQITSIALPGIGCGEIRVSPENAAEFLFKGIESVDMVSSLDHLKFICIQDVKDRVIQGFVHTFDHFVARDAAKVDKVSKLVALRTYQSESEARKYVEMVEFEKVLEDDCVICMCPLRAEKRENSDVCTLKCAHQLHFPCFVAYLDQCTTRKCCPLCRKFFAFPCGNQPLNSRMSHSIIKGLQLEGHEQTSKDTIHIEYSVPGGIQNASHPRPGVPYHGTTRDAYLPDSEEGRAILALLEKAFKYRLIFTVGDSITTGARNVVVWNNIHHKTNITGGPQRFGYPDATYLIRVRAELEEAGITEDLP